MRFRFVRLRVAARLPCRVQHHCNNARAEKSAKKLLGLYDSTSPVILRLTNDEIRYSHKLQISPYVEPCQDQRSRHGFFFPAGPLCNFGFSILDFGLGLLQGEAFDDAGDPFRGRRSRPQHVPARLYARTAPGAGPRPCFEGAQFVRRCAGFSRSGHLGKARRFLRRCAPISKVRTEICATSKGDGNGHRFRPARKPCLALTKITSRSGLDASERI